MTSWDGPQRAEGTPAWHLCPGPLCSGEKAVPWHMLMCGRDWAALRRGAPVIARGVWLAWADGRGSGTPAHTAAVELAVLTARRLAGQGATDGS